MEKEVGRWPTCVTKSPEDHEKFKTLVCMGDVHGAMSEDTRRHILAAIDSGNKRDWPVNTLSNTMGC